jgi:hypothetical protein
MITSKLFHQYAHIVVSLVLVAAVVLAMGIASAYAAYDVEDGAMQHEKQFDEPFIEPGLCAGLIVTRYELPISSEIPCVPEDVVVKQAMPWLYEFGTYEPLEGDCAEVQLELARYVEGPPADRNRCETYDVTL